MPDPAARRPLALCMGLAERFYEVFRASEGLSPARYRARERPPRPQRMDGH